MQDVIEREIVVRAPKEKVFEAITKPERLAVWFPDAVEGKVAEGERPIFDFGEYHKTQIYIVAVQPFDYFAYRWALWTLFRGQDFLGDPLEHPNTLVEFHLEATGEGTRVKVRESGFAAMPAEHVAEAFKENTSGWEYMMNRLEKLMNEE